MQSKFSVQLDPRFPLLLLVVEPPLTPLVPDELPEEEVDEPDVELADEPPGPSPLTVDSQAKSKSANESAHATVHFMEGRLPC